MRLLATIIIFGNSILALHAQKAVVGITRVQTAAQNISCQGWDRLTGFDCNADLAEGFRVMVETAVVKTGKMDVMEREQLNSIFKEQGFGESGLATGGGQIGGLQGIDYLIYGTITKFGARASGYGLNMLSRGRRQTEASSHSKITAEMAVDLKIADVSSGRIMFADTVSGEAVRGQSFSFGSLQSDSRSADPFADVQRLVAAKISEVISTTHIPIKVIQGQQDGTLILNYGNVFFQPGDDLILFEVGESFTDPDTGEVLGAEEREIGRVQITEAEQRYSKARFISEPLPVAAGTILKRPQVPVEEQRRQKKRKRTGGRLFR